MTKTSIYFFLFSLLLMSCNSTQKTEDTEVKKVVEKQEFSEADKIKGEEVSYQADSITMKGYLAYDQSIEGKRPAILVVHEWWGHNDYARKRADMLAEMGYIAFAVDMYGDGKNTNHPADAGKFMAEATKDIAGAKARFEKALEIIKAHPMANKEQTGAIGYCFGGGVILNMARMGVDLDGIVSFHGSLPPAVPAKEEIDTRILVCNGAADPFVKEEQIEAFKKEMTEAKADFEFINYEGAKHAFTNPVATEMGKKHNLPLAYDEKADKESWEAMTKFFKETFN